MCYVFIQAHLDDEYWLFPSVVKELVQCRSLVFLAEAHMGAPWSSVIFCSDSSGDGYCLMESVASASEVVTAGRYRERWRFKEEEDLSDATDRIPGLDVGFSSLLSHTPPHRVMPAAHQPRVTPLDGRPRRSILRPTDLVPPLSDALCDPQRWHLVVQGGWQFPGTIHCKEGRVCLSGLERISRLPAAHGHRLLSLCDNLSAVLAFNKGRSRDPALRSLCRRAAATIIGCELQWFLRYIETLRNPTDEGSRDEMAPGSFRCGNLRF